MKAKPFPLNDSSLFVEFHRAKDGPDYFVILYKNISRICSTIDFKNVWRVLGPAKFTPTGKELKLWAEEMATAHLPKPDAGKDTSFASDVAEEALEDSTNNTKMVM